LAAAQSETPIFDQIDALPLPHEQTQFFGHQEAEQTLLSAWQSGKMHHAWLLTGPKGIGKATFAYRAARFIFQDGSDSYSPLITPSDLGVDAGSHISRQVANRAHPNLLSIERPFDVKGKKFRTEITVDEVRKTTKFFGATAGENTWRVCIVDPADDLNTNAANALLKILEEPPIKTVFFLISHAPGKLLPTIRSRCRRLNFAPLENPILSQALAELEITPPDITERMSEVCEGSLRKAAELQSEDGMLLVHAFERLLTPPYKPDYETLNHLGDLVAQRGKDQRFANFSDLVFRHLSTHLHQKMGEGGRQSQAAMALATAWEEAGEMMRETMIFNLDKKQTVINVMRLVSKALRG
jgi:DNA polymerase-3 subunit delta'